MTPRPLSWASAASAAPASGWSNGSPPMRVRPSTPAVMAWSTISVTGVSVPPRALNRWGLMQPLHWMLHPWNQTAVRRPGPSAVVPCRTRATRRYPSVKEFAG